MNLPNLTREQAIALLQRLSLDEGTRQRLEDLLAPEQTVGRLTAAIERLGDCRSFGAESSSILDMIVSDIEHDVLPQDPLKALQLVERLLAFERALLEQAHDGQFSLSESLGQAAVVWVKAAGALHHAEPCSFDARLRRLSAFLREDEYRTRQGLLQHANHLFDESELRELVRQLELGALDHLQLPATALADFARALRDPLLYNRALQSLPKGSLYDRPHKVAQFYLECGDAAGALHSLNANGAGRNQYPHLHERIYRELNDVEGIISARREQFRQSHSLDDFRRLDEMLDTAGRRQLQVQICNSAPAMKPLSTAATLLFAVGETSAAADLLWARRAEIDGHDYYALAALAETADQSQCWLAATLLWRALLNEVLTDANSRAYHHAARYLQGLRQVSTHITDYRGLPTHLDYEAGLRGQHKRKVGFWNRVSSFNYLNDVKGSTAQTEIAE